MDRSLREDFCTTHANCDGCLMPRFPWDPIRVGETAARLSALQGCPWTRTVRWHHSIFVGRSAAGVCDAMPHQAVRVLHWRIGQRCGNAANCKFRAPGCSRRTLSFSVVEEHPVDAVLGWARRRRSDVIVMGTHGRGGASRLWLGSVAENVVRHSEVPVLVVRPRQHEFIDSSHPESAPSLKTILCPVNLTESARATLRIAACIADRFGARLVPLCVVEAIDDRPLPDAEKALHGWVRDTVQTSCPLEMICRKGGAADRINAFAAEKQADLVVLGAQRRGSASAWLFGGTTELVLRHAPVPVLVVPDSLPR